MSEGSVGIGLVGGGGQVFEGGIVIESKSRIFKPYSRAARNAQLLLVVTSTANSPSKYLPINWGSWGQETLNVYRQGESISPLLSAVIYTKSLLLWTALASPGKLIFTNLKGSEGIEISRITKPFFLQARYAKLSLTTTSKTKYPV